MELFLNLNGWILDADDAECISNMQALAAGKLGEEAIADWLGTHLVKQ